MRIEIEANKINFNSSMTVSQANKIIDDVLKYCSIAYVKNLYEILKTYIENNMSDLPEILSF